MNLISFVSGCVSLNVLGEGVPGQSVPDEGVPDERVLS